MSQHVVTVEDDPEHPEGGHALIHFEGLQELPPDASLMIEAIDEQSNDKWPVPRPLTMRRGPAGLAICVDERIVETLPAGSAVALTVPEVGVHGEVLWPALTPLLRQARRRPSPISQRARRVVADPAKPDRVVPLPPQPVRESVPLTLVASTIVVQEEPSAAVAPKEKGAVVEAPAHTAPVGDKAVPVEPADAPPPPVRSKGIGVAAAAAIAAFSMGAGAAIGWFAKPSASEQPPRTDVAAGVVMPAFVSPYEVLTKLEAMSPRGQASGGSETPRALLAQGHVMVARDPAEADYWYKQAARALLDERSRVTAATFNSLGNAIGREHTDASGIATARFLWEMAAVGRDCGAMRNLGVVHTARPGGAPVDAAAAAKWRDIGSGSCSAQGKAK